MGSQRRSDFASHGISGLIVCYRNIQDALVEKIWEGTVTVLSLDIVRATSKPGVLQAFISVRL